MKLSLTARPLDTQSGAAWIVFVQDKKPLLSGSAPLMNLLRNQIKQTSFNGDIAQTLLFPTFGKVKAEYIILAALGKASDFRIEYLERSAAAAVRTGTKAGLRRFATSAAPASAGIAETSFLHAVARGAAWGAYNFNRFKTEKKKRPGEPALVFSGPFQSAAACRRTLTDAGMEAEALCSTADLANLPANEATPQKIAGWARTMARANGLTCTVLNTAELKKERCNALLAVAAGSSQTAKIITLKYRGLDPRRKPAVLVGKTITFDSGGLSLKPSKSMNGMQFDKSGGMAVLAVMQMAAKLKLQTPVIGLLAVAENMPGGTATRPGDIIRSRAGKTVEILNTDAEGRLVLCDALDLALKYKPAALVDLATLTGAVIVALGHTAAAILGNSSRLTQTLIRSAEAGGERLWELPLWKEYKDDMKGTFADLQNISKSGTAGTITGAAFLSEFVPADVPWAHLDIAGTAWEEKPSAWMDPGVTLFGARTLIEWLKGMS